MKGTSMIDIPHIQGVRLAQAAFTQWLHTSNNVVTIGQYMCNVNPYDVMVKGVEPNSVMIEALGHHPFEIPIRKSWHM
jgi:hypothetical protein